MCLGRLLVRPMESSLGSRLASSSHSQPTSLVHSWRLSEDKSVLIVTLRPNIDAVGLAAEPALLEAVCLSREG